MSIESGKAASRSRISQRRVIKSAYKKIKYEAVSYGSDVKQRNQNSDYYVGIFDPDKNQMIALPVSTCY